MSWEYSENILVQNSAGNVLETRLGWDVVFAYNTEVLGESGTLGRKTYHDIVLTRYLKKALFENNDWMTEEYCTAAIKSLSGLISVRIYPGFVSCLFLCVLRKLHTRFQLSLHRIPQRFCLLCTIPSPYA